MAAKKPKMTWHKGGCHCGAVRFEARIAEPAEAQACNCSMCEMVGFIHLIVPDCRLPTRAAYCAAVCVCTSTWPSGLNIPPDMVIGATGTPGVCTG